MVFIKYSPRGCSLGSQEQLVLIQSCGEIERKFSSSVCNISLDLATHDKLDNINSNLTLQNSWTNLDISKNPLTLSYHH